MFQLLIVDDFFIERENVKDILAESGLPIEICGECDNGREALEFIRDVRPDFVLTDVEMPVMNGLELAKEIHSSYPDITTIIFSFYEKFEYVKKAMESCAFAYILKPIEADELTNTFEKLIHEKKEALLRVQNEEHLKQLVIASKPILKKKYIKEFFEGKHKDMDKVMEQFLYYDIPYRHNTYKVVVIEIDDYVRLVEAMKFEEEELLGLRMECILDEYMKTNLSLWTRINSSKWALLTWIGRENDVEIEEKIYGLCDRVGETMAFFDVSVSFGISNYFFLLTDVSIAVKQGLAALGNKFHFKRGQLIRYEDVQEIEPEFVIDLGSVQKTVVEVIRTGNEGAAVKYIRNLFDDMGVGISKEMVRSMCIGIVTSIKVAIEGQFTTLEDVFGNEAMIWEKIIRFETIHDIRNWLKNILVFTIRHLNTSKTNSEKRISNDVISYIEKYYDKPLTVKEIATAMHYNSNYLNNAFKNERGVTVLEYVTSYKLEKAKEIFKKNPDAKIMDVGSAVGYNNDAYFRSLFKRHVGISPKEYRQVIRRRPDL